MPKLEHLHNISIALMRQTTAGSINVIVNSLQRNKNLGLMSRMVFVSFDRSSESLWFFIFKINKKQIQIMVAQWGKKIRKK